MESLPEKCESTTGSESRGLTDLIFGIIADTMGLILHANTRGAGSQHLMAGGSADCFRKNRRIYSRDWNWRGTDACDRPELGIGFRSAWKLYGFWWFLSPLFGFGFIALVAMGIATLESIEAGLKKRGSPLDKWAGGIVLAIIVGGLAIVGGYFGARQDNPIRVFSAR